jgi:hypothetical protein
VVFLSGSESACFFFIAASYVLSLREREREREREKDVCVVGIPFTDLIPPHFYACPKPGHGYSKL